MSVQSFGKTSQRPAVFRILTEIFSIDHIRLQRPPGIQQDGAGHVSNRNGPVGGLGVYERLFEAHCLLERHERICIVSPVGGQLTRRHFSRIY